LQELQGLDPALGRPYPENAKVSGEYLRQRLADMATYFHERYSEPALISHIRGVGQMNAFDVPSKDFQQRLVYQSFLHGLHVLGTGERSMRLFGTVDQRTREADLLVHILQAAIESVLE
jgi:4-aminobutyrate aminotransferase-like enzyme